MLGGLPVLEDWVHCVLCQGAFAFLENAIRQILALRVLLLSLSLMVTSAADRVVASVLMHLVVPLENLRRVQSVARRVLNHQLRVVDRFAAPDAIEPLVSGVLLAACLLRDRGADDLLLDLSNTFVEFRLHLQIDLAFEVGHCTAHSGAILREHARCDHFVRLTSHLVIRRGLLRRALGLGGLAGDLVGVGGGSWALLTAVVLVVHNCTCSAFLLFFVIF